MPANTIKKIEVITDPGPNTTLKAWAAYSTS